MSDTIFRAGDRYQHFKGQQYEVIGLGRHSETLEEMVFYEALYDNPKGKLWARPVALFLEVVAWPDGRLEYSTFQPSG